MTIVIRIAPAISVAALLLCLLFAPAALAQDAMQQDLDFKNGLTRNDGVKGGVTFNGPARRVDGTGRRTRVPKQPPTSSSTALYR
jgi:hypothetical protein